MAKPKRERKPKRRRQSKTPAKPKAKARPKPKAAAAATAPVTDPPCTGLGGPTLEAARMYVTAKKKRDAIAAQIKTMDGELAALGERVLEGFALYGVQNITVDGLCLFQRTDLWPKYREGCDSATLRAALEGDPATAFLVEKRHNGQQFAAYIREFQKGTDGLPILPATLATIVEVVANVSLGARKAG